MTLRGSAFLALWNDVDPAWEAEYGEWHAIEHVPERVSISGFIAGRRCIARPGAPDDAPRYFTLYELESLAALDGPGYADVVERPTDWSRRMRPTLRNVVRHACTTAVSLGTGGARAMATIRLSAGGAAPLTSDAIRVLATAPLSPLIGCDGIMGIHLGVASQTAAATHPLQSHWADTSLGTGSRHEQIVLLMEGTVADVVQERARSSVGLLHNDFGFQEDASGIVMYEVETWVERSHLPLPLGRQQPRSRS